MKNTFLKFVSLIVILFCASMIFAQEGIHTSGGEATGTGGNVSYSVGQLFVGSPTGTGGIVTEGVQQPYEIFIVTEIENPYAVDLSLSAYPNPAIDNLNLQVESIQNSDLSYLLTDLNGRVLSMSNITETITQIDMSKLPSATYFVKVMNIEKEIKVFKIIKR